MTDTELDDQAELSDVTLKRALGMPLLTLYGVGTIIGAGIYVLIGEVAAVAGAAAPLSFFLAAVMAGFTAFSFAELSSRFPKSAGEAVYVREGLMRTGLPIVVGVLVVCVGMVSAATISNGFVGYLNQFVDLSPFAAITILLVLLGGLAIWGITESVILLAVITLLEIVGLALVIAVGIGDVTFDNERVTAIFSEIKWAHAAGIFSGAFLAFYAFVGFEDMVNVAEEVKNPSRTLPRAIILTLIITTLLYMGIAVVAIAALPLADLTASDAPLATIYEQATGRSSALISGISIFAVVNGALVQIIMASRILYGLRDEMAIFRPFGSINARTQTPILATALVTLVTWALAVMFSLKGLAEMTSAITLFVFALVNLALIQIKRHDPTPDGVTQVPIGVPIAGAVISASVLVIYLIPFLTIAS